ncbi:hypothetical protein [Gordonia aichiensis]
MDELWMLEDLEYFPDVPEGSGVCTPTTLWVTSDMMDLPDEVCSTVTATIELVDVVGGTERVAHLGNGFTTMIGSQDLVAGETLLTGCLLWDHYLWISFRTQPAGQVRMTRRGSLIQRSIRHATRHPGVFGVSYEGPLEYRDASDGVDIGYEIRWRASTVALGVE